MAVRWAWGAAVVAVFAVGAAGACSSFSAADEAPADAGIDAAEPDGAAPDAGFYARDTFERIESNGFGTAEIGGDWDTDNSLLRTAVTAGKAQFTVNPSGQNGRAYLTDVKARDVEMHLVLRSDKLFASPRVFFAFEARGTADTDHYSAGVVMKTGARKATLSAAIGHRIGDGETNLKAVLLDLDVSAIDALELRAQIFGTNPTNIRIRAWESGTTEPKEWQLVAADTNTVVSKPGPVGIEMFTDPDAGPPDSGPAFELTFDDFEVTEPRAE